MSNQTCSNCNAFLSQGLNGDSGVCRAHPPAASIVLIPRGQVQMELVPTPFMAFVQVPRVGWCREWQSLASSLEH